MYVVKNLSVCVEEVASGFRSNDKRIPPYKYNSLTYNGSYP